MQVFAMINSVGIMINADVNAKNWLIKVQVIMYLLGILVYVNVNMINRVMLENIKIIKNVNAERNWLIS